MPYPNIPHEYEYTSIEMDRIAQAFQKIYRKTGVTIEWVYADDPLNVEKKVDARLAVLATPTRLGDIQIKKTGYPHTFTVGVNTMHDYLNLELDIELLVVAQFHLNKMYIYNWQTFIDTAHEKLNTWRVYDRDDSWFHVIPISDIDMIMDTAL